VSHNAEEPQRVACAFCHATDRKISKEHVWPSWLRHAIDMDHEPQSHVRTLSRPDGEAVQHDEWSALPLDLRVRVVCKPCNEGWMERLEAAARPLLEPMLRNENVPLDADAQLILTQWATLRILVAQHTHPQYRSIPDWRLHRFYRSRFALPIGAQVWIGRYNGAGGWPTDYRHMALHMMRGGPAPELPNGFVAAFSVGYVAFFYFGHEIADGPLFEPSGDFETYFRPIWPGAGPVIWPPRGLLGRGGLASAIRSVPVHFGGPAPVGL
jgi:hypothetical protein